MVALLMNEMFCRSRDQKTPTKNPQQNFKLDARRAIKQLLKPA